MLSAGGHVMQSQNNMVLPVGLGIVFVEWNRGREGEVEKGRQKHDCKFKLTLQIPVS
jgi:hypothetical protein